jgi:hypothetical protein
MYACLVFLHGKEGLAMIWRISCKSKRGKDPLFLFHLRMYVKIKWGTGPSGWTRDNAASSPDVTAIYGWNARCAK